MQMHLLDSFTEQQNAKLQTQIEQFNLLMKKQTSQLEQIRADILQDINNINSVTGNEAIVSQLKNISSYTEAQKTNTENNITAIKSLLETAMTNSDKNTEKTEMLSNKINSLETKINSIEKYMEMLVDVLEND